ncbi:MAG: valine--tRNA ligase [Methylacidiphilales bacterium]|nr:valine--tRNA ligase [Candidatus Methylacidiphilales bacterium]
MPELAKAYEPQQVEDRLYAKWQESGVFHANPKSGRPAYSIVMPPPNVTGKLTLGHVLNNTLQDILCRKARMEGKEVLWLPGTDHAGLATQTAVEKHLRATEKKTRHDFTREEFVARVWKWKEEFGGIITQQLRKIGCSCDWSRERFTLDQDYERAIQEVFVKLFHEGLIYRGTRMVNWCPGSLTAISDEEVIPTKQTGFLYYVKYELVPSSENQQSSKSTIGHPELTAVRSTEGSVPSASPSSFSPLPSNFLVVATTRPETIMADVALAVKPGGKWAHLVDRKVIRPLHRAEIPIIADDAVEEGFGTGVLKVTPAHDKTDYEIGKRHNLPVIDILTPRAKIHDPGEHDATELNGLDRFEARKRSAEILKERGLLLKEEPYENTVGFSERANEAIEPRLSEQWFLKYPYIPSAIKLVREGHVKFHPEHWTKVYEHWLENIQDWCISRQVWWGHRIPVWYRQPRSDAPATPGASSTTQPAGNESSAATDVKAICTVSCQIESPGEGWIQDPDTLDTWFSSWLWAYETMRTEDGTRQKFYPTSVLVTGPDIIFLWVARMLIAGLRFLPSGPRDTVEKTLEANLAFKDVYFTGLIRDKQGRKLSKSLGNSPDPLDLIGKYGADGLRFGLVRIAPQGADIRFDEKQIEEGRNFCNKLWNICRFRTMQGQIDSNAEPWKHPRSIFADELLDRLHFLLEGERNRLSVIAALNQFNFSEAAGQLYDFVWNDFAARFVEAAKTDFNQADSPTRAGTLATFDYVMSHVLRLLHPFAPFVTEELWCELGFGTETIQTTLWPTQSPRSKSWSPRAQEIYATADAGRQLRGEVKLPSNQKAPFYLVAKTNDLGEDQTSVLAALLNASAVQVLSVPPSHPGPKTFTPLGDLYLPATGLVDPAVEKDRLIKELSKVEKDLEQTRRKLGDANMLAKAPPARIEEWRALEASLVEKEKSLRQSLAKLE